MIDPSLVGVPCVVCGEQTTAYSHALCRRCGGVFHLALRQDIPERDCGEAWISEEHFALTFGCRACLLIEAGEEAAAQGIPAAPAPAMPRPASSGAGRRRVRHDGVRARDVARRRRP